MHNPQIYLFFSYFLKKNSINKYLKGTMPLNGRQGKEMGVGHWLHMNKPTERTQMMVHIVWAMIHCAVTIVDVRAQVVSMPTEAYFLYK